jgi:hypothetical protein
MRFSRPRRPSPAMVLAMIALILALAGTAFAGVKLGRNSVGTFQLRNGSVTTAKLKKGAVTPAKISGCAADTVLIGPACIEINLRPAQGFSGAVASCAAEGKRLPFIAELVAMQALGKPIGDPELVGDIVVNGARFNQSVLFPDARVAASETIDTARRFRCVSSPV